MWNRYAHTDNTVIVWLKYLSKMQRSSRSGICSRVRYFYLHSPKLNSFPFSLTHSEQCISVYSLGVILCAVSCTYSHFIMTSATSLHNKMEKSHFGLVQVLIDFRLKEWRSYREQLCVRALCTNGKVQHPMLCKSYLWMNKRKLVTFSSYAGKDGGVFPT